MVALLLKRYCNTQLAKPSSLSCINMIMILEQFKSSQDLKEKPNDMLTIVK